MLARDTAHHGILLVHAQRWPRHREGIVAFDAALAGPIESGLGAADRVDWLV